MNRTLFYMILAILTIMLITGCGRKSEQDSMEKAAQKMEEAGEKMAESMGESMEGMAEGVEGMADALKEMGEAMGDSKVEPVDFRDLKSLLPEKLGSFDRTAVTGEKTSAFGIQVSQAEADYENDDRQSLNIKIVDMASMKKMVMMAQYGWTMSDFDRETDSGYEKTMTFKGYKGFEKYDTGSKSGEINLFVGERFVVEVNGYNLKIQDIKNALDRIDFNKLADLKN